MSDDAIVVVTGGTGFLGAHCVVRAMQAGYRVRTTVRDRSRAESLFAMLRAGGVADPEQVEIVEAELTADRGWDAAVAGARYVLHTASPYPATAPRDERDLIEPARDGSLRVLRAARDAGVERVVLTSSFAAIGYGHAKVDHPFTELDWTDPDAPGVEAYQRSKTLAERAAWDFVGAAGGVGPELSVVAPVGIVGPLLSATPSTSMLLMTQLLNHELPAVPRLTFGIVDVRDAAELHLLAMTRPEARGERFLATAGDSLWVGDVARILHDHLGEAGRRVPLSVMPDLLVRALALVRGSMRPMVHDLGVHKHLSDQKARDVLGWEPRSAVDALVATGESLEEHGLIRHLAARR